VSSDGENRDTAERPWRQQEVRSSSPPSGLKRHELNHSEELIIEVNIPRLRQKDKTVSPKYNGVREANEPKKKERLENQANRLPSNNVERKY
jgi:hypothetical protein